MAMNALQTPPCCLISLCRSTNSRFINFPAYGTTTYQLWVKQLSGDLTQKSGIVTGYLCDRHFSFSDFQTLQSGIGDAEGILPTAAPNDPLRATDLVVKTEVGVDAEGTPLMFDAPVIKQEPLDEEEVVAAPVRNVKTEPDAFTAFREALARVYPNKQPNNYSGAPTTSSAVGGNSNGKAAGESSDFLIEEKYKPEPKNSLKEIFKKFDNVKKIRKQHAKSEKIAIKTEAGIYPLSKKQRASAHVKKSMKLYSQSEVKPDSFQCHQCQRPFQRKGALVAHLASHFEGLTAFMCPMCGEKFPNKHEFSRHMASHSDEVQALECDKCMLVFPTQDDLDRHSKTHPKDAMFQCQQCKCGFQSRGQLVAHMEKHGSPSRRYTCRYCGAGFKASRRYREHEQRHRDAPKFKCRSCPAVFENRKERKDHTKSHKLPFDCHHCASSFPRKVQMITHLATHFASLKQFVCPLCGIGFTARYQLEYHVARHGGERNFICETCSNAYKTRSDLREHEKVHASTNLHQCHHCSHAFKRRSQIIQHMAEHFLSLRKFMCDICGMRFTKNFRLASHVARHSDKREYRCHMCPAAFKGQSDLNVHAETHSLAERQHKCYVCDKSFRRAYSLKRHETQAKHLKKMSTAMALHTGLIHLQQNAPATAPPPQQQQQHQQHQQHQQQQQHQPQFSPMALNTTNHQPAHMGQVPAIFQMQ